MSPADHKVERRIAENRKARFEYEILDRIEAGIVLQGTEVKSLREGKANLKDSYAAVENGEVWLIACHISPYECGGWTNHEPERRRKLLLHKREIDRLGAKTREGGLTLVPLRLYFKGPNVKVELALARGKKLHDKRQTMRDRDLDREARAAIKSRGRD